MNELGVGESAVRKILQKRDEIKQATKLYGGGNLIICLMIVLLMHCVYLFIYL